jgi:hypothetical protein
MVSNIKYNKLEQIYWPVLGAKSLDRDTSSSFITSVNLRLTGLGVSTGSGCFDLTSLLLNKEEYEILCKIGNRH